MAMLDSVDYRARRARNDIRRSWWNRVAEALPNKRDALVLYLPGEMDLDRKEAVDRGFSDWNLIAVEANRKVASKLRLQGRTVIHGRLADVMEAWPAQHPVAYVAADLQCGWGNEVERILNAYMSLQAFNGAVLLVNLQRGRDSTEVAGVVRDLTSMLAAHKWAGAGPDHLARTSAVSGWLQLLLESKGQATERGEGLAERLAVAAKNYPATIRDSLRIAATGLGTIPWAFLSANARQQLFSLPKAIRQIFWDYERENFECFWPGTQSHARAVYMDSSMHRVTSGTGRASEPCGDPAVRRRIAAALALRTMRRNGDLRLARLH